LAAGTVSHITDRAFFRSAPKVLYYAIMDITLLNNIAFSIDTASLAKQLRIKPGSQHLHELERLVEQAQSVGRPKAMYGIAYVESRGDDYVIVEGTQLTSRVLRVNLEQAHRVFPYAATCGVELHHWANPWADSMDDLLQRFWADAIQQAVLRKAMKALEAHITEHCHPGPTSTMSPGRLEHWPLEEQRPLFDLLGDTEALIGVRLTDTMLMVPTKSLSGIRFPTAESFESCQLCPRERCPGRGAPYDESLYRRKYGK
jgi:hypothetical protein